MRTILLTAFLILISANYTIAQKKSQPDPNQKDASEIKLYTFDGGQIQVNELSLFSDGKRYKGQQKTLSDPFFVIKHPKGTLLWDTGLPESLITDGPGKAFDGKIIFSRQDSITNQLKKIGLAPNNIDYIAFSHSHFDHVGGATPFNNSTLLVQKTEYNFFSKDSTTSQNPYARFNKVQQLTGDFDIFGDQKVIIKSYPGHTTGHQTLYVELANEGPVILTGDLYHFNENRINQVVPVRHNYDVKQTRQSMKKFEKFVDRKDPRIIIQHEMKDFIRLPSPPQYLK